MTEREKLAAALSIVEAAVQDMAAAGILPLQRATALAMHMQKQVDLGASSPEAAAAIKLSFATQS
jgi:hypothetical protein